MLKNILKNPAADKKAKAAVLADLRRVLETGRRVGFLHNGQLLGRAIIVAIEDDRLLFEPLEPVDKLMAASMVNNIEQGMPWDFSLMELQEIKEGSDTYLQCTIPSRVNINSRRDNFRVSTPHSLETELHFQIDGIQFIARILDLSRTGAQIRVQNLSEFPLEIDQVASNAELKLGNDESVVVDFHLRWTMDADNALRAGIEFADIPVADSDRIHHLVCEVEREIIRKIKALD
jgi:hypothetical protein